MMCVQTSGLQIMGRKFISKQMKMGMRVMMVTMRMMVLVRKVLMMMEVVMVIVKLDRSRGLLCFWKFILYPK